MTGSLAARDLSVRYATPQGSVHALRHVDMDARPGEVIGIVGESGCGKSTLVTAFANLLPANASVEGSIRYGDIDLVGLHVIGDRHRAAERERFIGLAFARRRFARGGQCQSAVHQLDIDVLASDAYAADVRADEKRAQLFGVNGVPFFVLDERYGISGAQPAEQIVQGLEHAWSERAGAAA